MHDNERKKAEHREKVNGARRLPASKEFCIPWEAIHCGGRHGDTGENCQGAEYKDDSEIGDLLERVVAVKSIELRWLVECRIVYPCIPGLEQYQRRLGNEPPPLFRIEKHDGEKDARNDEAVDVKKM